MKNQGIFERRMISLELLKKPENLNKFEQLIYIRIFDIENFELSGRSEILINKNEPLIHLANKIIDFGYNINV